MFDKFYRIFHMQTEHPVAVALVAYKLK